MIPVTYKLHSKHLANITFNNNALLPRFKYIQFNRQLLKYIICYICYKVVLDSNSNLNR